MPLLQRALYEIVLALISLSILPMAVAVVAPLATIARVLSFIIREFRSNFSTDQNTIFHSRNPNNNNNNNKKNNATAAALAEKIDQNTNNGINQQQQPGCSDCVVIVNAASSLEAEGLVRYYISRGCTVVACDRNEALLQELFSNVSCSHPSIVGAFGDGEDGAGGEEAARRVLLKTVPLLGPETVQRVKEVVAACCSASNASTSDAAVASSTTTGTRLGNSTRQSSTTAASSSSYSAASNRRHQQQNTNNSSQRHDPLLTSSSLSSSSSSTPNNPFGPLSLYAIVFVEPSGEIIMRRRLEREFNLNNTMRPSYAAASASSTPAMTAREIIYNLCEYLTKISGGDDMLFGGADATASKYGRQDSTSSSHHRRASSIDSASSSSAAAVAANSRNNHNSVAASSSTTTFFSQTITRSLSEKSLDNFIMTPLQTQLTLLRELTPIALRSQNFSHAESGSSTKSKKPFISLKQQQPRVCVISRPHEDEELASAVVSLVHYASSSSYPSLFANNNYQQVIQSLTGLGAMRRTMTQALLDACKSAREHYHRGSMMVSTSSSSSSFDKKTRPFFLRTCHIELFSTAAQQASQKRWMQRLMHFYCQHQTQQNQASTSSSSPSIKRQWRVPKVPFFSGSEREQRLLFSSSSSASSSPNASPTRFGARFINEHSATLEDFSNCTYQISILGDIINIPKPKSSTSYSSPMLSIHEPYDEEIVAMNNTAGSNKNSSSNVSDVNNNNNCSPSTDLSSSTSKQHQFEHLSFWTRVFSWSLREERLVDVVTAAFHSSPRVEDGIKRVFEYLCS